MRRAAILSILVSCGTLAATADVFPGSRSAREKLAAAQSVAVGYVTEDGRFLAAAHGPGTLGVLPEDQRALAAIEARLAKWGRLRVVDHPRLADVLIAVRTGRRLGLAAGVGGGRVGGGRVGRGEAGRLGGQARARNDSGEDVLLVFEAEADGGDLLWEDYKAGGFAGPLPLFEALATAIESVPARR
jgi:hypothetical protein